METVVYGTTGKITYVIQFQSENGDWVDTYPSFRSSTAAIKELNSKRSTPYPYRVVERKP